MSAAEIESVDDLLFVAAPRDAASFLAGRVALPLADALCRFVAPLDESNGHLPTVLRAFIRDKGPGLTPEDLALCNELLAEASL